MSIKSLFHTLWVTLTNPLESAELRRLNARTKYLALSSELHEEFLLDQILVAEIAQYNPETYWVEFAEAKSKLQTCRLDQRQLAIQCAKAHARMCAAEAVVQRLRDALKPTREILPRTTWTTTTEPPAAPQQRDIWVVTPDEAYVFEGGAWVLAGTMEAAIERSAS